MYKSSPQQKVGFSSILIIASEVVLLLSLPLGRGPHSSSWPSRQCARDLAPACRGRLLLGDSPSLTAPGPTGSWTIPSTGQAASPGASVLSAPAAPHTLPRGCCVAGPFPFGSQLKCSPCRKAFADHTLPTRQGTCLCRPHRNKHKSRRFMNSLPCLRSSPRRTLAP